MLQLKDGKLMGEKQSEYKKMWKLIERLETLGVLGFNKESSDRLQIHIRDEYGIARLVNICRKERCETCPLKCKENEKREEEPIEEVE